jgi:hypothetical protein
MFLNARLSPGKYSPCKILHRFKRSVEFFERRRATAVRLPRAQQKAIRVARFVTTSNKTERGRPLQSPPLLRSGSSACALQAGVLNLVATQAGQHHGVAPLPRALFPDDPLGQTQRLPVELDV